jgi:hypothetical protein
MPKRIVKHLNWEIVSEQTADTPAIQRRAKKYLIKRSLKQLAQFESAMTSNNDLWQLASCTFAAYYLERHEQAEALACQAVKTANEKIDDRNAGDAMHAGHSVLGLLALKNHNHELAIEHLHASAKVPCTPVLMSFGPRMLLAKELLILDEIQSVMTYFELCRVFWTHGDVWLSVWEKKIHAGRIPNFSSNLY